MHRDVQTTCLVELETPCHPGNVNCAFIFKQNRYAIHSWAFAVNNMHFSHLVKVRKNSHSLSLQAFLTHSHSLSLSLAGLFPVYNSRVKFQRVRPFEYPIVASAALQWSYWRLLFALSRAHPMKFWANFRLSAIQRLSASTILSLLRDSLLKPST